MNERLSEKCYDLLGDLMRYEVEVRDCLDVLQGHKERVLEILKAYEATEDPDQVFTEVAAFLALQG